MFEQITTHYSVKATRKGQLEVWSDYSAQGGGLDTREAAVRKAEALEAGHETRVAKAEADRTAKAEADVIAAAEAAVAPVTAHLATERQVQYAWTLVVRATRSYGISDRDSKTLDQLRAMTRGEISQYIDMMKEQY